MVLVDFVQLFQHNIFFSREEKWEERELKWNAAEEWKNEFYVYTYWTFWDMRINSISSEMCDVCVHSFYFFSFFFLASEFIKLKFQCETIEHKSPETAAAASNIHNEIFYLFFFLWFFHLAFLHFCHRHFYFFPHELFR